MDKFLAYALPGLFTGAAYAIAASGLVLTYTTTRIFNVAHGAFGMVLAFLFWKFSVVQGLPVWLSFVLVVFVVAPLIGVAIQVLVARNLGDAPVSVGLVVTVGLFVICVGSAQAFFPADAQITVPRAVAPFYQNANVGWLGIHYGSFKLGDNLIPVHNVITIGASILVALGLYLLLNKTRIGTAMRAAVDNPELLKLFGGKPERVAMLSWAIGMSLAGLAGVLLVSAVQLDYYQLTLLVVNAYAAAVIGKLKSLPRTFVGAMGLGLASSFFVGYVAPDSPFADLRPVIPMLVLFGAVVLLPSAQLRIGQVKGIKAAPVPTVRRSIAVGAAFLVFVLLVTRGASDANQLLIGTAATYAITMLSLVLLTGYGGYVSLAQLTFVGVGALAYVKLDQPNLGGLLLSSLIAAAAGALVALPVIRLTGLYLALSTLAFAIIMDGLIFTDDKRGFGYGGSFEAKRLSVLGHAFNDTATYVFVMAIFFVAIALGVLALRRGIVGRMLIAMRDSPAACGTLGLDQRWFRVGLFALSAGVAGLAGALYSGLRMNVGASDFQPLSNLPLLLLVVVFGATSITGAALGGTGLMLLPVLGAHRPVILGTEIPLDGVLLIVIGVGAVLLGNDPNGLANYLFTAGRKIWGQLQPQIAGVLPARFAGEYVDVTGAELLDSGSQAEPAAAPHAHAHAHTHAHEHAPSPSSPTKKEVPAHVSS